MKFEYVPKFFEKISHQANGRGGPFRPPPHTRLAKNSPCWLGLSHLVKNAVNESKSKGELTSTMRFAIFKLPYKR